MTTSARKTVNLPQEEARARLRRAMEQREGLVFVETRNDDVLTAAGPDGSRVDVASLRAHDGRSIVMIDHKGVPADARDRWHGDWRQLVDETFT